MKPITDQRLRSLYDLLHKINPGWEVYIWIQDPKNPRIGEISFNKLVDRDRIIAGFYFQRGETDLADHLILACEDYLLCSPNDTDQEEVIVAVIKECFSHSE